MNKRQRKKHRIGEFQELGFELRFSTPITWSAEERETFLDICIKQTEVFGLAMGGGCGEKWKIFVVSLKYRTTVKPAQRDALIEWLTVHPDVTDLKAGPLVDAWYNWLLRDNSTIQFGTALT